MKVFLLAEIKATLRRTTLEDRNKFQHFLTRTIFFSEHASFKIASLFYIHLIYKLNMNLVTKGITFSWNIDIDECWYSTFAKTIANFRCCLNMRTKLRQRCIPKRRVVNGQIGRYVCIYGNDFCEHIQNASILSVECFVITVIAYYVRKPRIPMRHWRFYFCIEEYALLSSL